MCATKETVEALTKLAKVADAAKTAGRSKPPSGAAISAESLYAPGGMMSLAGVGAVGAGDPKWLVLGALGAGLSFARQNVGARLLASPKFAQKLAGTPISPKAAAEYWSRPWVAGMAKAQPAIAAELLGIQRAVLNGLGAPMKAAAESGDQQPGQQGNGEPQARQ